ncbi:MAG TPA: hypothetical protein VMT88_06825 [Actinomycetes bacterium]|nr:hypothetical protein [Actinomycetes bacterium]
MSSISSLILTTDGQRNLARSVRRLCTQGRKPDPRIFVAHARAYSCAAAAVTSGLRRFCDDDRLCNRRIEEWANAAKTFERTSIDADRTDFSGLSVDAIRSNWDVLITAETRMLDTLVTDVNSMEFRVLAGRFRREQDETFHRVVNLRDSQLVS